jgi:hypothetical protein
MSLSGRKRDRDEEGHNNADGATSGPHNDGDADEEPQHQQDQPQARNSDTTTGSVAKVSSLSEARHNVTESFFQSQPLYSADVIHDGSSSSTHTGQLTSRNPLHQLMNQVTSAHANLATQQALSAAPVAGLLQDQLQHRLRTPQLKRTPFPSFVSPHAPVITQHPVRRTESQSLPQQSAQSLNKSN